MLGFGLELPTCSPGFSIYVAGLSVFLVTANGHVKGRIVHLLSEIVIAWQL